jgi:hypothetical protein
MLRSFVTLLILLVPLASRAAPVEIALAGYGLACTGGPDCTSGASLLHIGGTLDAELGADLALTDIQGILDYVVLATSMGDVPLTGGFEVVGGTLDLDGDGDPGAIASYFELADGRTLFFPDVDVIGPFNGFDGQSLFLAGTTADPLPTAREAAGPWLAVALVGGVRPGDGGQRAVPEPGSLLLLGAGGLLVGAAVRRSA